MFDGLKFTLQGFAGYFTDDPEARRLIWPHIVVTGFSFSATAFVAWVSFTRYSDLVGTLLPYPEAVAWIFTSFVALFILTGSSYVATYIVQHITRKKSDRELNAVGAVIFFISTALVAYADFHMNIDGAETLATQKAGTVTPIDEASIMQRYDKQIATLKEEQSEILQKYTWKGTTYFRPTKYHPQEEYEKDKTQYDALDDHIMNLVSQRSQALQTARDRYSRQVTTRDETEAKTFARLSVAVRWVYFIQFMLCLVGAYISNKLAQNIQAGGLFKWGKNPSPALSFAGSGAVAGGKIGPRKVSFPLKTTSKTPVNRGQNGSNASQGGKKPAGGSNSQGGKSTPGHWEVDAMTNGATDRELEFLRKYAPVVDAVLAGKTKAQAGASMDPPVSQSTVKNVKRAMKQAQII